MSKTLFSILPDPVAVLSLEPEELAGVILEILNSLGSMDSGQLNRHNFSLPSNFNDFPNHREEIAEAVMEAWGWLEREGLIASKPGSQGEWVFVTRRGKRIHNQYDLDAYRKVNLLPKRQLHPMIAQKVWATFLRGEYDTAIFQAFKEVEVSVRSAGSFAAVDYGVTLMRNAFNPENGPLTDKDLPKSEREALGNIFSGAIGLYKNPHSHRSVEINAEQAVEMIMLASHLLNIVDSRNK
jgi:uncharacterized protein (TIGR02391 family)